MSTPLLEMQPDPYFKIFPEPKDRLVWENYIRYASTQTHLSPQLRSQWIDALQLFSRELGSKFLSASGHRHPLTNFATGTAPWQIQRLIEYANTIKHLKSADPDYSHFLNKLKSPVESKAEAIHFLNIASMSLSMGFRIRFPKEIHGQKNPDLIISDPQTENVIEGEVSVMGESDDKKASRKNYYELAHIIDTYAGSPLYSARQITLATKETQVAFTNTLSNLSKQVTDKDRRIDYKDEIIDLTIFPLSQEAEFQAWLHNEDRRKGFNGPPPNFDDTSRISGNKLKREANQIRPDRAGLIFIPVSPLHFWHMHTEETTRNFQYRLSFFPNIIGVYLFAEIIQPSDSHIKLGLHAQFTQTPIHDPLTRYSLFVRNNAYASKIHPATMQKIGTIFQ